MHSIAEFIDGKLGYQTASVSHILPSVFIIYLLEYCPRRSLEEITQASCEIRASLTHVKAKNFGGAVV